jgi:hypothetical protein
MGDYGATWDIKKVKYFCENINNRWRKFKEGKN